MSLFWFELTGDIVPGATVRGPITAHAGEGGKIPPQNVQIRYANMWEDRGWALPSEMDILQETPPPQVGPLAQGKRATAPVWPALPGSASGATSRSSSRRCFIRRPRPISALPATRPFPPRTKSPASRSGVPGSSRPTTA